MILQSENPIRMVRELKGAPLSILMVLSLMHQRVTQEYLERATGYTDKPVSQALAYMQEIGLADHTNAGWQLIKQNVMQLPLPLRLEDETKIEDLVNENPKTENVGRNNSDSLNYLKVGVVEDINNLNTSTITSLNLSDEIGKIPTLEEIQRVMDAAEDLFGHAIMGEPRDYADINRLLSWITQAYDGYCQGKGRLKVENPAGLVYWAFHQGKNRAPGGKYIKSYNQDQCLPESFKRKSGQWDFEDEEDEEDQEV
jgi:hypothetical protein